MSAEIYWDYEKQKRKYPRVLKAVALLGAEIPAVPELQPLHEVVHTAYGQVRAYETELREVAVSDELLITLEQMDELCPSCAEKMRAANFKAVKINKDKTGKYQIDLPPETVNALCEKWGPAEGFRTRCMESSAAANVNDPGAFCNALKDACGMMTESQPTKEVIAVGTEVQPIAASPAPVPAVAPAAEKSLDDLIAEMGETLGVQANAQEIVKRLIGSGLVAREDYAKVQQQLVDEQKRRTEEQERQRTLHVEQKVAAIVSPRLRALMLPLYDLSTREPKTVKYSEPDKQVEEVGTEALLDKTVELFNWMTKRIFGEEAKAIIERPEAPPENARDEADRRAKAYAAEKKIGYREALHAVLQEDADLKDAYARS